MYMASLVKEGGLNPEKCRLLLRTEKRCNFK
jgi:hypothetical protein